MPESEGRGAARGQAARRRAGWRPRERRLSLALFLLFLGLYLLPSSRWKPTGDAIAMWEVADNIIAHQSVTAQTQWNVDPGRDGKIYCLLPLLTTVVHLPGAALHLLVARISPAWGQLLLPLACHLAPAALGALTCALFFRLARRFVGRTAAGLTTIIVGLGTAVGYYARSPYSEILQTACFTGLALAIVDALRDPSPAGGRRLGLWLGLLINAKLIFALSAPGVALLFVWRLRHQPRRLAVLFAWAAAVLALLAIPILWYNWVRFGGAFQTGYGPTGRGTMWKGAWGLLFSPGKSVFLYNPPLVLGLCGVPALLRRRPLFALAIAAAALPVFLFYAQFMYWDGDWEWGPRYLTPFYPACCVPLALIVDRALRPRHRVLAVAVAAALAFGGVVQVLGSLFYRDHWISVALVARESWLGTPLCGPPNKRYVCFPDGKHLFAEHWLPQLSPLVGHLWLVRHVPFGDPFARAENDAPWQFEGKIHIPKVKLHYDNTLVDFWPLTWGQHRAAAALAAALMAAFAVAGVLLWRRQVAALRAGPGSGQRSGQPAAGELGQDTRRGRPAPQARSRVRYP